MKNTNWKVPVVIVVGVLAVILMIVFGIQSSQNKAIAFEEQVNTAQSDIKVQEKRRVDLVYNLADCVKQYDNHESETLKAIVDGRESTGDIENVTTAITAVAEAYPELKSDDDKLRRYFKTKFRNRLNDEVRRQESVKRQANRQCYIEISDIAFCLPNKELDAVDRLVYDEQLNAFRNQLSSEDATKLDRLLAGECFRGRKKMIRELKFWMVDFDPYNEDD